MRECFGDVDGKEGKFSSRFGSFKITAWIEGKELCVESDMGGASENEIPEILKRYNRFLERATGYTTKERIKMATKSKG